jgi:hypothetical protein
MAPDVPSRDPDRPGTAVFLVGLFGFALSALGFLTALILGVDVRVPLATNAASALLVVLWVAADRLRDPDSGVTSVPGAVGTTMLLLAAYGLVAAVVLAGTSFWHARFSLVWYLLGAALVAGVLGALTFPLEVLTGDL